MTRTARYNAKTNTFRELPGMEKPIRPNPFTDSIDVESLRQYRIAFNNYESQMPEYQKHLSSLREIPCHESCKGVFIHDCDYEEGKHYKLQDDPCPYFEDIDDPVEYTTYAYPIVSPKSEDELWNGLVEKIATGLIDLKTDEEIIADLKQFYTLTPR